MTPSSRTKQALASSISRWVLARRSTSDTGTKLGGHGQGVRRAILRQPEPGKGDDTQ